MLTPPPSPTQQAHRLACQLFKARPELVKISVEEQHRDGAWVAVASAFVSTNGSSLPRGEGVTQVREHVVRSESPHHAAFAKFPALAGLVDLLHAECAK